MTKTKKKQLKKAIKDLLMRLIRRVDIENNITKKPIVHKHKLASDFAKSIMYEILTLEIIKEDE
jgi:hypothetical protein